ACRFTPPEVHANLTWALSIISHLRSKIPLCPPDPINIGWWGDASSSFGIGVIISTYWAPWKWKLGFEVRQGHNYDIGQTKALSVKLGL
ncbi:hypothetical protein EDD16DRAFT_1468456, partial [Pisolithus croceorrhizus]